MTRTETDIAHDTPDDTRGMAHADRDLLTLGIAIAAIILFVGTGTSVVGPMIRSLAGVGGPPDRMLVTAMLLNIALIIFGWRRYRQLAHEIEERRKAETQARHLAETDPLTGSLNRRSLHTQMERLLAAHGGKAAVMMIDLDNFKQINDFNGHSAGDQILVECARRIASLMPPDSLLARLGGDEFALVLTCDPRRAAAVEDLADAIIEAMTAPVACNGTQIHATVSVGLARSSQMDPATASGAAASHLLHMADIAMYHAKKQGRNRLHAYEEPMEAELQFRRQLEAGIRQGIGQGEFVPFYEQQIDLETGELTGFEMLARWNSPVLGDVSPKVFIPMAEEIGAIGELSECVIRKALEDAKGWDASLTLAVNISPLQLRDPWFSQKLLKMLVAANFPPQRLEIEITESCLHENVAMVRSLIASLKNQGIRVSLDDFGTGYSSLAQLRNLPFDRIKIDRSFVTSLNRSDDSAAIVHAIALLGKGLGLPITVEGIENPEILMLRQYGNIKGQGYLYGHPQSVAATRRQLAELDLLSDETAATHADDSPAAEPAAPRQAAR
ncbi:MAG: EAL domain-containing protein [Novosphingobium sp.]|nr:EAL domain-containing protein [Novosphingobium sp.]